MALGAACVIASIGIAPAPAADKLPFDDGPAGITCRHYDLASGLRWRHEQGDWLDVAGKLQGEQPFAEVAVADTDASRTVEWDLTTLVRAWRAGMLHNDGVLIRAAAGKRGTVSFHSREAANAELRPALVVRYSDGRAVSLAPLADAHLMCSTHRALGTRDTLNTGHGSVALLRFDIGGGGGDIASATLRLTTTNRQAGATVLGVYAVASPNEPPPPARYGLAASHASRALLARDPDVLFVEDFEANNWRAHWSHVGHTPTFETVSDDVSRKFVPHDGRALRVQIAKDAHLGLNLIHRFRDRQPTDPEEIHLRYYLRLADDWNPTLDGGKLPGLSGTYDRGGWGGRKSDGENGWSMRGGFQKIIGGTHPLAGRSPIGTYAYHADGDGKYGEFWSWSMFRPVALERNRWYCIEQFFRVNTPGSRDGVMKAWVDGVLVFERTDVRVRDVATIRIEQAWMNVYHGGTSVSPRDQHLYIDDVVVAKRYIGP